MASLNEILEKVKDGELSTKDAEKKIRSYALKVGDVARFDLNREGRTGIPEVVLCENKTASQVIQIVDAVMAEGCKVILSRVNQELLSQIEDLPYNSKSYPEASLAVVYPKSISFSVPAGEGPLLGIITAGTVDIPVALEARVCAEEMGCRVISYNDVGVAGIHRLFKVLDEMNEADAKVIIVAAGREGALPSVVSGLTDAVVIGLPVSSGYGYGGGGEAALMGMLQSCSPLLTVNIDAGVVAGLMAAKIISLIDQRA